MTINNYYSLAKPLVGCGIMMLASAGCGYKAIKSAQESFTNRNKHSATDPKNSSLKIKAIVYAAGCLLTGVLARASFQMFTRNAAFNQILARGGMIIHAVVGKS